MSLRSCRCGSLCVVIVHVKAGDQDEKEGVSVVTVFHQLQMLVEEDDSVHGDNMRRALASLQAAVASQNVSLLQTVGLFCL